MRLVRWRTAALLAVGMLLAPAPAHGADPEEAHYNVVVSLYNAGQWQAALTKIQEREKLELPPAMRARYLCAKGLALEKGAKPAEARAAYEQVVTQFEATPEAQQARVALLYLDYAKGDHAAVIANHPKIDASKLTPANRKNIALMLAESLYAKQDAPAAQAAYRAAIAAGADAAPLAPRLFDLSLRLGLHADLLAASAQGVTGVEPALVALARTEALLALNRFAEAEAEAQKVPAGHALAPRASLARGQALVRLNRLKDAAAPLKLALAGLKNPPPPPAAYLALAECLLESSAPADAARALEDAQAAIRALPAPEQARLNAQVSLLRLRTAATGDRRKLIAAIGDARASLPPDQLPKALYMRLYALSQEGDHQGVIKTFKDDYPLLQSPEHDGPATLIYHEALAKTGRAEEAQKLIADFIARKPAAPEATRARLLLASAALERNDLAQARVHYDALAADAKAPGALGKNAFDEALFNRGVVLQKLGDQAAAAQAFAALVAAKPDAALLARTLPLLGQAKALQKDYAGAAAAWRQALATPAAPGSAEEADLRDRLVRVLFAANDFPGTIEQCDAAAKAAGEEAKLARPLREIWARALFSAGRFPDAAARYQALYKSFSDAPGYAYEAAVALDRANQRGPAAELYAAAQKAKAKLPPEYAAAVDLNLALARLEGGIDDLGLDYWMTQAQAAADAPAFEAAAAALRRIAAAKPFDAKTRERLAALVAALPAGQPRRFTLGAQSLLATLDAGQIRPALALADQLAAELAEHEAKLDPKSTAATIAPAMINFARGEALRRSERVADALAAYETVLAAYPYNEWPDAAAVGIAECYAALGDRDSAVKRLREAVAAAGASPASAKWRQRAQDRLAELEKIDKKGP